MTRGYSVDTRASLDSPVCKYKNEYREIVFHDIHCRAVREERVRVTPVRQMKRIIERTDAKICAACLGSEEFREDFFND